MKITGKDKFIQQYIPNNQIWQELILSGFSPNSNGQCEAIKRMIALITLNSQTVENPLKCKTRAKEIMSMETWFWSGEKIKEALSIPLDNPRGKRVSLHENVGIGFHLFKRIDNQRKPIADLYADDGSGGPVLPMAIIIEKQSVKCFHQHEDGTVGIFIIPQDDKLFLTAAKMTCLLNQKLVNVEKVKAAPRHYRKRWGMHTSESKSEVNVVTWRKNKHESNKNRLGVKKNITRHFVREHWRLQPYPSKGVSKLIWIDTYIRGNMDSPLHNKDRINVVIK